MALNINSLVRTIGGQEKVIDKDKALLELANAIENGGGGVGQRFIKAVFGSNDDNTLTKIDPIGGIYTIQSSDYKTIILSNTDNQPQSQDDYVGMIIFFDENDSPNGKSIDKQFFGLTYNEIMSEDYISGNDFNSEMIFANNQDDFIKLVLSYKNYLNS